MLPDSAFPPRYAPLHPVWSTILLLAALPACADDLGDPAVGLTSGVYTAGSTLTTGDPGDSDTDGGSTGADPGTTGDSGSDGSGSDSTTGDDPTTAGSTGTGDPSSSSSTSSTTGTTTGASTAGSGDSGDPNGDGWQTVDAGTTEDLVAVDFANTTHGWVVGTGQVLLHTTDGGQSWHSQENGFWTGTTNTVQLNAHVLGSNPAWGVYHLLDVHAVSQDVAWISSMGPLAAPVSLNGDNLSAVFVTSDGGSSWRRLTLATNFQTWGIHGFDNESARVASIGSSTHADSDVFQIENGASQSSTSVSWGALRAITFVDTSLGFMAGDDIYRSTNGGTSWQSTPAPGGYYQDIDFVDANMGFAVGGDGEIVATIDGGDSWQTQDSGTTADLYGISFADSTSGTAVGDGGTVLVTTDGGLTWITEDAGTSTWINGVKTVVPGEAWAVGDGGVLLHRLP
jgi:photosystem II stability/assembly factor-like uncharacterized protein